MNSLNRHGVAAGIGIQALGIQLLLSLSPSATAHTTPIQAAFSRSPELHAPWATTLLRPLMEPALVAAAFGSRSDAQEAAVMTLTLPTDGALDALAASLVIQSTGAIEADRNRFRELLGNPDNIAKIGQQPTGHREINWDGVPAAVTNVADFPKAFFNTNSPRGLVYDSGNRGLQVSDRGFTDINPTYAAEFLPFSGSKVFAPRGLNESGVQFLVAGSNAKALVRGFGVVFMDVDTNGSSGIELFGAHGEILGRFTAPVRSDARGASFVGVVFRNAVISRARIFSGDGRLEPGENDISQGGLHDLVVIDDLLYGEPIASGS